MFYEAEFAFNEGANDGFWRFQLRDKYGRWIKMGGLCAFEYRIPGDKKVYRAYGTFEGNRRRGFSVVRVGEGQPLSPGDYEIDSRFIERVKAIIRSKETIAKEANKANGPKKLDETVGKEAESKQVVASTVGNLEVGDIVQQSTAEALYGRIASVDHAGDKTRLNVEWSDGSAFDMELPKDQKIKVWNRDDVVEPEDVAAPKSRFTPPTDPAEIEALRVRAEEQKARVAEANKEREARLEARAKQEAEAAEDYRMTHRPPSREDTAEEGVAASLDKIDEVFPADILDPAKQNIYSTGDAKADKETFDVINSIKGNPDAEVTIYRGVPGDAGDEISAGDWVTLSPSYAQQHIDSNVPGGKVISMKVKASDLFTNADSINEWGYDPEPKTVDAPNVEPEQATEGITLVGGSSQKFWKTEKNSKDLKDEVSEAVAKGMLDLGVSIEQLDELNKGLVSTYDTGMNDPYNVEWDGSVQYGQIMVADGDQGFVPLARAVNRFVSSNTGMDLAEYLKSMSSTGDFDFTMEDVRKMLEQANSNINTNYSLYEDLTDSQRSNMAASTLLSDWAASSNGNNARSLAIQEIAESIFGIKNARGWKSPPKTQDDIKKIKQDYGNVLEAFLRAQYDLTQKKFKDAGVKEVVLYRGISDASLGSMLSDDRLTEVDVQSRPLSSWSTDDATAYWFATGGFGLDYDAGESEFDPTTDGIDAVMIRRVVPVEQILSSPFTGVGCYSEKEMVVIGGEMKAEAVGAVKKNNLIQVIRENEKVSQKARDEQAARTAARTKEVYGN